MIVTDDQLRGRLGDCDHPGPTKERRHLRDRLISIEAGVLIGLITWSLVTSLLSYWG